MQLKIDRSSAATVVGWLMSASVWSTVDFGKLAILDRTEVIKVLIGCLVAVMGHLTNHGASIRDAEIESLVSRAIQTNVSKKFTVDPRGLCIDEEVKEHLRSDG